MRAAEREQTEALPEVDSFNEAMLGDRTIGVNGSRLAQTV